jgi:hypothetical protein
MGTEFDNRGSGMGLHWGIVDRAYALAPDLSTPDNPDDDDDETPETPLDEPRPPRVQDPPPQPDTKGPYVVRAELVNRRRQGGDYGRA